MSPKNIESNMSEKFKNPYRSTSIPVFLYMVAKHPDTAYVSGLSDLMGYSHSTISEYFKKMKKEGLVSTETNKGRKYYRIKEENITEIVKKIVELSEFVYSDKMNNLNSPSDQEQAIKFIENNEHFRKYLFIAFMNMIAKKSYSIEPEKPSQRNNRIRKKIKERSNFEELANKTLKKLHNSYLASYDKKYGIGTEKEVPNFYKEVKKFFDVCVYIPNYGTDSITSDFIGATDLPSPILAVVEPGQEILNGLDKSFLDSVKVEIKNMDPDIKDKYNQAFNFDRLNGPSSDYKEILNVATDLEETKLVDPIWAFFSRYGLNDDKMITIKVLKKYLMDVGNFNQYSDKEDIKQGINKLIESGLVFKKEYGENNQKERYEVTGKGHNLLNLIRHKERLNKFESESNIYIQGLSQVREHHNLSLNIFNLASKYKEIYLCPQKLAKIFDVELNEVERSLEDLEDHKVVVSKQVSDCKLSGNKKHKHYRYNLNSLAYVDMVKSEITINKEMAEDLDPEWKDYSLEISDMKISGKASKYRKELAEKSNKTADEFQFNHKVKYSCPECENSWIDIELLKEVGKFVLPDDIDPEISYSFSKNHMIKGLRNNKRFEKEEGNNNKSKLIEDGHLYFFCPVCAQEGKKIKLESKVIQEEHTQEELDELYEYLIREDF